MSNCTVIVIANQKGGVGKTSSTASLVVALAKQDKRVLLVDGDPQGDLTSSLGWPDTDALDITLTTQPQSIIDDVFHEPKSWNTLTSGGHRPYAREYRAL